MVSTVAVLPALSTSTLTATCPVLPLTVSVAFLANRLPEIFSNVNEPSFCTVVVCVVVPMVSVTVPPTALVVVPVMFTEFMDSFLLMILSSVMLLSEMVGCAISLTT
ncbi:hypothetical protein BWP33_05675 [Simonsiella muelleri ATCC 29453]|nr:hypothetical protein [Simonsiella muelleri]AUX61346.1 hypothetical protein BWP33_05675 [Simonsiella muelleri ATCC 29453]